VRRCFMNLPKRRWLGALGVLALAIAGTVPVDSAAAADATPTAVEPQALQILEAASSKLAGARTMSFTARNMYEVPGPTAAPVYLITESKVTLQRPDGLRILTQGDGTELEFYYDGKSMTAIDPGLGVAATSDAPPTIDAMLKAANDKAGIYFPFDDVIVSDPGKVFREGLASALYIGQSKLVGGVVTDIVVVSLPEIHGQLWIGAEDKLPRMVEVTYPMLPGSPNYMTVYSDWQIDPKVDASSFVPENADKLSKIEFGQFH
jgi:hypothetical protein